MWLFPLLLELFQGLPKAEDEIPADQMMRNAIQYRIGHEPHEHFQSHQGLSREVLDDR